APAARLHPARKKARDVGPAPCLHPLGGGAAASASSLAQREAWAETFSLVVSTLPTPSISAAMRLASSTWAWLSTLPVRKTTPSTVSTSILVPATSLSASRLDFTLVVIQVSETGWLESASAAFFFCGSLSAAIAAPENITAVRATARMEAFLRMGYLLG